MLELLKNNWGRVDRTRPKSCESTTCYDQHQWTNPSLSCTELLWQALWAHEVLWDTTITQFLLSMLQLSLHKPESLQQVCIPKAKHRVVSDSCGRQGPLCRNHHLYKCLIKSVGVNKWDSWSYTAGFSPTEGLGGGGSTPPTPAIPTLTRCRGYIFQPCNLVLHSESTREYYSHAIC